MDDMVRPPTPRATPGRIKRDQARIRSEIEGTDGGIDPFTAAVRATRMPMLITDPRRPDNPIVFVNDAFCRLTGYAREEVLGRNCRFLQGPQTDPADVARIRAAVRERRAIETDIRNHRKDGTPFWNRLLLAPVNDANGQLAYFFASQLDVTLERERLAALEDENAVLTAERRAAQRRLEFSEESLRLATEAAEVGTWDLDLTTEVLTWSDRTKAMFGISHDVPCSMADFYDGLHSDDAAETSAAFAAAVDPAQRTTYDAEYRTVGREDGVVRWVAARGRGIFDDTGRCVRAIGTAIDVTERKVAEAHLRFVIELSDKLRAADSALSVKMTASRALGRHLHVGRAGYGHIVDHGAVVSVERDWTDGTMASLAGEARVLDAFGPALTAGLRQGRTLVVGDCRTDPRTDGPDHVATWDSIGTRALIVVPLLREGELAGVFYLHSAAPRGWTRDEIRLVEDVAERTWFAFGQVEAETALRALNATLEDRVTERTAELERTHDALRQAQKLEAVGQLTGGVAHDFNNLLTIIRSSTDLLRRPGLPEERQRRYVDAIADTVDRAAKLTGQLLAFARRQALKPEVFNPADRIEAVTDMLHTVVGSRVKILTDIACEDCFVEADASQFETAIVNMVVNARDAMDGEGTLTLHLAAEGAMPPLRGHAGGPGRFVAVSITDTGHGIPADKLGQIFEPFFTTKEVGKGTGLGLSQVYGFAKQSGGDVAVRSQIGQGTTFTLYLPRTDEAPRDEAAPGAGAGPAIEEGRGRRVLVVEDNREVGAFCTQLLEDLGYETIWAGNADEALALLSPAGGFDVVFSDVMMPGMSGLELGEEIRRRHPGLPVVLTSGYSHVLAEEGRHGFELLHKPYAAEELSRVLRRATRRSAGHERRGHQGPIGPRG